MKEQPDKLTPQETEQLCSLYMDCKLSALEETELRYFLSQVDYHSPLIDETRQIMDIDTYIANKPFINTDSDKRHPIRKWAIYAGIAASIAVVMGIGVSFLQYSSNNSGESQPYYVAYVDGHRLSDEAARIKIEEEKKSADDFIKEMTELEAHQQQIIDNFFDL